MGSVKSWRGRGFRGAPITPTTSVASPAHAIARWRRPAALLAARIAHAVQNGPPSRARSAATGAMMAWPSRSLPRHARRSVKGTAIVPLSGEFDWGRMGAGDALGCRLPDIPATTAGGRRRLAAPSRTRCRMETRVCGETRSGCDVRCPTGRALGCYTIGGGSRVVCQSPNGNGSDTSNHGRCWNHRRRRRNSPRGT